MSLFPLVEVRTNFYPLSPGSQGSTLFLLTMRLCRKFPNGRRYGVSRSLGGLTLNCKRPVRFLADPVPAIPRNGTGDYRTIGESPGPFVEACVHEMHPPRRAIPGPRSRTAVFSGHQAADPLRAWHPTNLKNSAGGGKAKKCLAGQGQEAGRVPAKKTGRDSETDTQTEVRVRFQLGPH